MCRRLAEVDVSDSHWTSNAVRTNDPRVLTAVNTDSEASSFHGSSALNREAPGWEHSQHSSPAVSHHVDSLLGTLTCMWLQPLVTNLSERHLSGSQPRRPDPLSLESVCRFYADCNSCGSGSFLQRVHCSCLHISINCLYPKGAGCFHMSLKQLKYCLHRCSYFL